MKKPSKFDLSFQNIKLAEKDGKVTSEIQLFKYGNFVHWSGEEFGMDVDIAKAMKDNFDRMKAESKDPEHIVPIDYNHGSLSYGVDEAIAGGWITELSVKEDGLYATVQWTTRAADLIKNEEYRFISPEFAVDVTDEFGDSIEGPVLYAAALTNRPFLKGMEPVSLSIGKVKHKHGGKVMKEKLIKVFALAEDADEKAVLKAAEEKATQLSEAQSQIKKLTEENKNLVAKDESLNKDIKDLTSELVTIKAEVKKDEAARLIVTAKKEGKILPEAEATWLKLAQADEELFKELLSKQEVKVDLSEKGSGKVNADTKDDLHEAVLACQKDKGISYLEAYRKVVETKPELVKAHAESTRVRN